VAGKFIVLAPDRTENVVRGLNPSRVEFERLIGEQKHEYERSWFDDIEMRDREAAFQSMMMLPPAPPFLQTGKQL
jgi:hypothetical protein